SGGALQRGDGRMLLDLSGPTAVGRPARIAERRPGRELAALERRVALVRMEPRQRVERQPIAHRRRAGDEIHARAPKLPAAAAPRTAVIALLPHQRKRIAALVAQTATQER